MADPHDGPGQRPAGERGQQRCGLARRGSRRSPRRTDRRRRDRGTMAGRRGEARRRDGSDRPPTAGTQRFRHRITPGVPTQASSPAPGQRATPPPRRLPARHSRREARIARGELLRTVVERYVAALRRYTPRRHAPRRLQHVGARQLRKPRADNSDLMRQIRLDRDRAGGRGLAARGRQRRRCQPLGSSTVSMTWITPFVQAMSAVTTLAPSTVTPSVPST